MKTWYIVKRYADTLENTFATYEEAELMALAMVATTGNQWMVETVVGWDR